MPKSPALKRNSGKIRGPVLAGTVLALVLLLVAAGFGIYLLFRQNVQLLDLQLSSELPVYGDDLEVIAVFENKGLVKTNYLAEIIIDNDNYTNREMILEPEKPLELQVDISGLAAGSHTLSLGSKLIHFTIYRPAEFELVELTVEPDILQTGETASVNLTLTNTGDLAGDFSTDLLYDGIPVEVLSHFIEPGTTVTLETHLQLDQRGSHEISADRLSRYVEVLAPAAIALQGIEIDKTYAEPGEPVQIRSVFVNSGDIAGEHLVELLVNGEIEHSRTIKLNAGESAEFFFETSGESAGRYEIQIEDMVKTLQVVTITRPANGALINKDANSGYGRLTLVNEFPDSDAFFVLTSTEDQQSPVLTAYVHADSTAANIRVKDGLYFVYYTAGNDYDSSSGRFMKSPEFGLFEEAIQFETTYSGSTTYYSIWTISINVDDGNVEAVSIEEDDFPE